VIFLEDDRAPERGLDDKAEGPGAGRKFGAAVQVEVLLHPAGPSGHGLFGFEEMAPGGFPEMRQIKPAEDAVPIRIVALGHVELAGGVPVPRCGDPL
jgi:hypothetical protein